MKKRYLIISVAVAALMLTLTGCAKNQETISSDKLQVIASILPVSNFVSQVGGNKVVVESLIPPGYEPHSYELSPNQLTSIADADLYVKTGYIEFEEANMDKIIAQNSSMKVINGAEGISLREMEAHTHEDEAAHDENEENEHTDPHTWLSIANAKQYVNNIATTLSTLDPENQDYYEQNRDTYLQELDQAGDYLNTHLSTLTHKEVMVYHPAFGYLLDEYDLEQIPVELEGKEPTAAQLQELIEHAREDEIKIIFVQTQFSTNNAQTIANEIQGTVVQIDPLAPDFTTNLRGIADAIAQNG